MGLLDDAIREHLDLKRRRGADPTEVERAEREALGPVRRGPVEPEPPELILDQADQADPAEWDDHPEDERDGPELAGPGGAVSYLEPDAPLEPRDGVAPELFDDRDDPFAAEGPFEPDPAVPPPVRARYEEPEMPAAPAPHVLYDEPGLPADPGHYDDPVEAPAREHYEDPAPPPHRARAAADQLGQTVEYDVEEALDEDGHVAGEHGAGERVGGERARPAAPKPGEGAEEDPLEETPEFLQETPDHDRLWFEQRPPRDFDFDG